MIFIKSLKELRMTINDKEADLYSKTNELREYYKTVKHILPDKSEQIINDTGDKFASLFNEIKILEEEIVRLKLILQNYNSQKVIEFDGEKRSVLDILAELRSIRHRMEFLEGLIKIRPSIKRIDIQNSENYYYEKSDLNYDVNNIVKERDKLRILANKYEAIIDGYNSKEIINL
ncbi:hypothetical protein [Clostridium sp.]|uniref:hypothetical protein n=1 Tax=Clostridium sp. TaxID=1506 RepID=UPI00399623D6